MTRAVNPRREFADALKQLRLDAGKPARQSVVADAKAHVDPMARHNGAPILPPSHQRLGEWESARHLPRYWEQLELVLKVLIEQAEVHTPVPSINWLYNFREWQTRYQAADTSKTEPDGSCPYRGLEVFESEHAAQFFGRGALIEDLLRRLAEVARTGGLMAVVGSSGSGKSSLVRAGLLPRIAQGGLEGADARTWPVAIMAPGASPLDALGRALPQLRPLLAATAPGEHAAGAELNLLTMVDPDLGTDAGTDVVLGPRAVSSVIDPTEVRSALRAGARDGARTVLFVDQFEELFTVADPGQRQPFLDVVAAACTPGADGADPPALVIISLRSDFSPRCADAHDILRNGLQDHQLYVGPMKTDEVREVILGPAEQARLRVDGALVELMLADAGLVSGRDQLDPGVLPMVSHALAQTWEHRRRATLTVEGYRAAGGIRGAIEQTAQRAWAELDEGGQRAADQLMLGLVHFGDGGSVPDTRRRCDRDQLIAQAEDHEAAETALEVLARHRMVTLEAETVQLAHEALLHGLPRLRALIEQHREHLLLRQQVETDAEAWMDADKDAALLYRGSRLDDAEQWVRSANPETRPLGPAAEFVARSTRHRKLRRWLVGAGAMGGVILAVIAVIFAVIAGGRADAERIAETLAEADRLVPLDPSLASRLDLVTHQLRADDPEVDGRLLSTQNSPLAATLPSASGAIYDVGYATDARTLVTASYSGIVQMWDLTNPAHRVPVGPALHVGSGYASSAVFSPDGNLLVAAGEDGTIRTWDARDRAHPRPLGAPLVSGGGEVFLVRFSPDGRWLAAAAADGSVRLFSFADPAHPVLVGAPLRGSGAQMRSVAWSNSGRLLAAGNDDGQVLIWDTSNPQAPARRGPALIGQAGAAVHTVAFSPDATMLAAGGDDKHTRIWDLTNPEQPTPLGVPLSEQHGAIWSVAFAPDGRTLASAAADGTVRLWGVARPDGAWSVLGPLSGNTGPMWSVAFAPDGHDIAAGGENGTTLVWSLPTTVLVGQTGRVLSLATNRAGTVLASGGADRCVRLWDIHDLNRPRPQASMCGGGFVYGLAVSPDGRTLVSESAQDAVVKVWDIHDPARPTLVGQPITRHTQWAGVTAFSPDGTLLATGDTDNTVQLWDATNPAHLRPLGTPLDAAGDGLGVNALLFPDPRTLITVSSDGTARLWDISNPQHAATVSTINPNAGQLLNAALSPDGRTLATTGEDKRIRLWDIGDRAHPSLLGAPLSGASQPVDAVAFDPTGHTLESGGADATARIWDVTRPAAVPPSVPVTGPTAGINAIKSLPDGHFVTGSEDNTIMIWDPSVEHAVSRICATTQGAITPDSSRETRLPYTATCGE